jgi:hydrogenase maturation factor
MLLPEGSTESNLKQIMEQIDAACRELGITLIGGHTETTPGLDRPILVGFMMGETSKENYITTGGASPGDMIVLTKAAGIEGTAIIANDLREILSSKIDPSVLEKAREMIKHISIVPEAMKAIECKGVNSLHDPTEGGVLNGVWELAEAANVGVIIKEAAIRLLSETEAICKALDLDPLKLLGSGALLITIEPEETQFLLDSLARINVEAQVIGEVLPSESGRTLFKKDGTKEEIVAVDQDEVYRILEKFE